MTGFAAGLVILVSAWNPAVVAERSAATTARWLGLAAAAVAAVTIALFTDPILSGLDVSIPTFRTAAGAVVALTGARWLAGSPPRPDEGSATLLGFIDGATPAVVAAAMAVTAVDGWWMTVVTTAIALLATLGLQRVDAAPGSVAWLRRLIAGVAVAAGVALIYAGIRAV